jgi:hypothetical protein
LKRSDTLAKRTAKAPQERPTKFSPASLLRRTPGTAPARYHSQVGRALVAVGKCALIVAAICLAVPIVAVPCCSQTTRLG